MVSDIGNLIAEDAKEFGGFIYFRFTSFGIILSFYYWWNCTEDLAHETQDSYITYHLSS